MVKTIGGMSIIILIILCISLIWNFDWVIVKLIGTDIIVLISCFLMDKDK